MDTILQDWVEGGVKPPAWMDVEWDTKPTPADPDGCDGLYIRSYRVSWWYLPVLFTRVVRGFIAKGLVKIR